MLSMAGRRGGARDGAGRKRKLENPVNFGVQLERWQYDALRERATKLRYSLNEAVRAAVMRYLRIGPQDRHGA
jgi:hypothetical protein